MIELGCGVGGLCFELEPYCKAYLGVDSSFASIALARHLALGAPYPRKIRIPNDLLQGSVSFDPEIKPAPSHFEGRADFIVGDLENLPEEKAGFDLSIVLNAIDMLDDPSVLPKLQRELVRKGAFVLQSCPYIWHESVSRRLRGKIPKSIRDSAKAGD